MKKSTLLIVPKFLANLLRAIWIFIPAFLSVIVIGVLLITLEQGVDVVTHAGEYLNRGTLAYIALVTWAYLLWYTSRRLSYVRQDMDDRIYIHGQYNDNTVPLGFYIHIPRFLAYACFVLVQIAIYHLPSIHELSGLSMLVIFLLHAGLYVLIHLALTHYNARQQKKFRWIATSIIVLYLVFLFIDLLHCGNVLHWKVFHDEPDRHVFWLRLTMITLFVTQVISVWYFIRRRKKIDLALPPRTDEPVVLEKKKPVGEWASHPRFTQPEEPYYRFLKIITVIAGALYLTMIFVYQLSNIAGPMALALLSIGILTGLANIIQVISIRIRFSVFFILYAIAIVWGHILPDPYNVRLHADGKAKHFSGRPGQKEYVARWINYRINKFNLQNDSTKRIPVYIVLSNGGASRAGQWTSSVLSRLQDESRKKDPDNLFSDHILAIAGASGGTVGNCAFYSLLKAEADPDAWFADAGNYSKHTNLFFHSDFLTFTLGRLLGPDMIRHLVPITTMDDRAASLEHLLEHSQDNIISRVMEKPVSKVFERDDSARLPILYITTTQVDNGMPGIISSVKLSRESSRNDILKMIDDMPIDSMQYDLNFSTAAILSSRFPYVSPAGKIKNRYYVDGGYFDNSGAGTILELVADLNDLFTNSSLKEYKDNFTFHIIHNSNAEVKLKPVKPIHPLTNDLLSPLITLGGIQGSSTSISDKILTTNFLLFSRDTVNSLIRYNLYDNSYDPEKHKNKYEEGYPMSWVISDYQLDRMKAALVAANVDNKDKIYFMHGDNTVKPAQKGKCCVWFGE